jgi:transformation/transcription domain-associated protein
MTLTISQELIVVFRHLLNTPARTVLINHIEKLLDERVLFGSGIAAKESYQWVPDV